MFEGRCGSSGAGGLGYGQGRVRGRQCMGSAVTHLSLLAEPADEQCKRGTNIEEELGGEGAVEGRRAAILTSRRAADRQTEPSTKQHLQSTDPKNNNYKTLKNPRQP